MRISRIYRLLRLISMLQSGRSYTANELAEELEVSRRTVFRDLNMLEMAHIPYYYDDQRKGYRINRHFFLPPVNLTLSEALAMLAVSGRLRPSAHLPLLSNCAAAAVKLENALPTPMRRQIGGILDHLAVSLGKVSDHTGMDETFCELAAAVAERRICRIRYDSFHEAREIETDIHPLRVVFVGRAWYVIAHSALHRQRRTFKLVRIRELTVTDRPFTPPAGNQLDDYFGSAWSLIPEGKLYDVHLHFEPMVAGNVAEVRWHDSQQIDWNEDGSIEFRVRVDGLGEITWWILGYGDQVEVLYPPELRRRVAETVASTARKYAAAEDHP